MERSESPCHLGLNPTPMKSKSLGWGPSIIFFKFPSYFQCAARFENHRAAPFIHSSGYFLNTHYMHGLLVTFNHPLFFSNIACEKVSVSRSVVPDSVTPWTVAHQAPLSMRFSRQGYWNGLPFPSPGDLPNSGIKPRSPALQAGSLPTELQGKP